MGLGATWDAMSGRTAVLERITFCPDGDPSTLSIEYGSGRGLGMRGSGPAQTCIAEQGKRNRLTAEAGSLLVEAESVGDRGGFPPAGDSQLGENP